ncbi:MAG: DUF1330 domain-containing protein, partial [Acidimicrobiia bacterium]
YTAAFLDVLKKYEGTLLAVDDTPDAVEGEWPHQRMVIAAFESRDAWWRCYRSSEYSAIVEDRLASTTALVLVVEGVREPYKADTQRPGRADGR